MGLTLSFHSKCKNHNIQLQQQTKKEVESESESAQLHRALDNLNTRYRWIFIKMHPHLPSIAAFSVLFSPYTLETLQILKHIILNNGVTS